MDPNTLREDVEALQNMLIARATGGAADDAGYRTLRDELMNDALVRDALPSFVRSSRDLSQFWAYISKHSGYATRRTHIWEAFNPLLDRLEFPAGNADAAPTAVAEPASVGAPPPRIGRAKIPVFISYSTQDKAAAGAVKHAITSAGFECFLAHEDLQVSEEWKERILEELERCQLLIVLLSKNYRSSNWGSQEIGVIVGRKNVPIVPLSLDDTLPYGFLAHIQGKKVPPTGIELSTILEPLARKHPRIAIPALIQRVHDASSFRSADAALGPLVPIYDKLTNEEINALADASINNGQVWDASLCRTEYLPELLSRVGHRMDSEKRRILSYQLENGRWYREE
jgi:hypothetical protein